MREISNRVHLFEFKCVCRAVGEMSPFIFTCRAFSVKLLKALRGGRKLELIALKRIFSRNRHREAKSRGKCIYS